MSKKHVSWLLVAILIVAGLLLLVPGKTGRESGIETTILVPGLADRINDVARVRIARAGDQPVATLVRTGDSWVVEELHSYPADWSRLKALLASLAKAEITERKTSNPEYFGKMGVADITAVEGTTMLVELGEGDGKIGLLIGNGAQGREGQYVRFADGDQVLLINQALTVPALTSEWLDRSIIDLPEAEIVEVDLTQPDGETLSIRKVSADETDFTLQDIPKGREIESSFSVNALGGSLAALRLDEVKPDSEVDWSKATHLRALTADGLEINAELVDAEKGGWLRLESTAYTPAGAGSSEPAPTESTEPGKTAGDEASEDKSTAVTGEEATSALEQRVEAINKRVKGWAYLIEDYKADLMTKRKEDLLKAPEKK